MENVYTIKAGDIIRHGSGDGWIRVDGFNGEIFDVTDMDLMEGDVFAEVGQMHPMTTHDMLCCIKADTGRVYDNVNFIDQKYRVKPEYSSMWGSDTDENSVVTHMDAVRFAHDWQKSVYAILNQLEEVGDSLWEGYDPEGNHVKFETDHFGRVWVCRQDGRELWNDEYYTEDGLEGLKVAILNEGYRLS